MSDLQARLAAALGADAVAAPTQAAPTPQASVLWVRPHSTALAAEAMALAHRDHLRVLPAGRGTQQRDPRGFDFVLSSARLDRVLEYEPEDQVVVVEAGTPLAALDAALARHAQRLAPDPWGTPGSSIGGAVAENRCGLSRRGRGTWRDWVLGARVVHADGRISKSGARVVKNVAGFDLAKLWIGSFGSLAFLAEIALRVVPRPEARRTLLLRTTRSTQFETLRALHRAPLMPQALLAVSGGAVPGWARDDHGIVLRFEGRDAAVAAQVTVASTLSGDWEDGGDIVWQHLGDFLGPPSSDALGIRMCGLPTAGREWLDTLASHGCEGAVVQFGVGVAHARLPIGTDRPALARALSAVAARSAFEPAIAPPTGGAPDAVAMALARATKDALDPRSVLPRRADLEQAS